ncbi:MAG TPA: HAD family phosphatase [Hyphomicrobiales bacterium]|nr:HAD family phosphatase [Hyphomicrobiales bacterium]
MKTVVFDIGNVLLRWDPRHLYRSLFDDEREMEWFLATVCDAAWNLEQDRGRPWREAVETRIAAYPQWERHIRAYDERWHETVAGPIDGSVAVLAALKAAGVPVYAISNFSAAKYDETARRFPFLDAFDGVVISGREGLVKPDPRIFRLFLERYRLDAGDCVFIDDSEANARAAQAIGMAAVHFRDGLDLAAALAALGVAAPALRRLPPPEPDAPARVTA